jgi:hypothetical protein
MFKPDALKNTALPFTSLLYRQNNDISLHIHAPTTFTSLLSSHLYAQSATLLQQNILVPFFLACNASYVVLYTFAVVRVRQPYRHIVFPPSHPFFVSRCYLFNLYA